MEQQLESWTCVQQAPEAGLENVALITSELLPLLFTPSLPDILEHLGPEGQILEHCTVVR